MSNLGSYEYVTNDIGANGNNIIVSSYAVSPELAGGGDCFNDVIRPIGVLLMSLVIFWGYQICMIEVAILKVWEIGA